MRTIIWLASCVLLLASPSGAQTRISLKSQSRGVDFSSADSTKPFKLGDTLPSTCTGGEIFLRFNATGNGEINICTNAGNTWTQVTGSAVTSGLGLQTTRVSDTSLVIGDGCSTFSRCNVRFGSVTYSITSSATISLVSGSGTAFLYVTPTGSLVVASSNLSLSCSTCLAQTGVSAFPADSIPLASWTATSGVWDLNGGADWRAALSASRVAAGIGFTETLSAGNWILGADPALIPLRAPAPATASSTCAAGAWALDASFVYFCVQDNQWKRTGVSSW